MSLRTRLEAALEAVSGHPDYDTSAHFREAVEECQDAVRSVLDAEGVA